MIRAEKLSKRYRITPTIGQGWRRNQRVLTEDISQAFKKPGNVFGSGKVSFWALQDVSFEAKQGDIMGIIGRNGAGKSTLLKLLGRITEPTSGRAIIYGRVGSLLEVGTGFHSELTGRQNIFISGAILGMSRTEIKRKFDEIVDFSGVEKFLDTPVKRFSSGMEVRLAFSVAVHLHPQVLLVDEVLSVGDAVFQKKSIEKIRGISANGGTVLFVSHNMSTVASLCNQAMVLEYGKVVFSPGSVSEALNHYHEENLRDLQINLETGRQGGLPAGIKFSGFSILDEGGIPTEILTTGQPVKFQIGYHADEASNLTGINISILIKTMKGDVITILSTQAMMGMISLPAHHGQTTCSLDKLPIVPENISITLIMEQNGQIIDRINDAYVGLIDGGGHLFKSKPNETSGFLFLEPDWSIQ